MVHVGGRVYVCVRVYGACVWSGMCVCAYGACVCACGACGWSGVCARVCISSVWSCVCARARVCVTSIGVRACVCVSRVWEERESHRLVVALLQHLHGRTVVQGKKEGREGEKEKARRERDTD